MSRPPWPFVSVATTERRVSVPVGILIYLATTAAALLVIDGVTGWLAGAIA